MKKVNVIQIKPEWRGHQLKDSKGIAIFQPDISGKFKFGAEIWIDGLRIDDGFDVDVFSLLRSVHETIKRYQSNIITCGCGSSGCAGIIDGVVVTHHGRFVFWTFRSPLKGGFGKRAESDWVRDSEQLRFRFSRTQLIRECNALLEFAKSASGNRLDICTFATEGSTPAPEMFGWIKHNWTST